MKELEQKVASEVAENEFDQWADAMDLDLDESNMDAEDLAAYMKQKRRLIRQIEQGHLTFNDDGEAVYTPHNTKTKHDKPVVFHERTGAALMASDGKKKNHHVSMMYAMMGDMCKVHPSVFAGMAGIDAKVCESLFNFLMD